MWLAGGFSLPFDILSSLALSEKFLEVDKNVELTTNEGYLLS